MSEDEHDNKLLPCPCCGSEVLTRLGEYEICPVCGWEDDPVQSVDADYAGGANNESLNQCKIRWLERNRKS